MMSSTMHSLTGIETCRQFPAELSSLQLNNRSIRQRSSLKQFSFTCGELASSLSCASKRRNVTEDTDDDMFDDKFKKKATFNNRKDEKTATADVDDDAESLSFAVEMAKIASDTKAADIKLLFVKPLVYWTRFFIIGTAFSTPQIEAIRSKMVDLAQKKFGKTATGDTKANTWTLLDFGDVVVHIFNPQQRAYYNLEEFYGNAPAIELPFTDQQQPVRP